MNIRTLGAEAQAKVVQEMTESGRVPVLDFSPEVTSGKLPIAEMIGTDDGAAEFVEKTTYDAYQGRENVPLLYKSIYRTLSDANFPKTMTANEFGPVQIVFLEKFEGGEVKFGSLGPETQKIVSFATYAAGLEYNEDIIEYNQTWRVTDIGVAFGEAYNHLLNHLHLSPIISGSYTTTGGGNAAQHAAQVAETPTAQLVAFDTDIATTLADALQILPNGSILLINSFDQFRIEEALAGDLYTDLSSGPVKRRLSLANAVVYDGATVTVGEITYTYSGVTAGEAYLIAPQKQNFVEYIKHDLRIDSDDGDLSRLILTQIVGRARRAVMAQLGGEYGAVKVELES